MEEEIIKGFNNDKGFIKNNDFKLISVDDKEVVLEYTVKKEGLNVMNIVHGGLLFGLADSAAGTLACMSGKYPLTINSSINYLNTAKCKKLIAKASVIKLGSSIGYYKVDIFDENDVIICTCNIDFYFIKKDK